ncbi:MAG: hypothetical protein ACLPX5_06200 [Dissulfurispiraceae bacterium]
MIQMSILDTTKELLDKGKELGLTDDPIYKQLQKVYDKTVDMLKFAVRTDCKTVKEMSKEDFKEDEHPRAKDGKFAKKVGTVAAVAVGAYAGYKIGNNSLIAERAKTEGPQTP